MLALFSLLQPKSIILPLVLIASASGTLYLWSLNKTIKSLQSEVVMLEANNAQLATAVETQKNTISFLRTQAKLIEQEYREIEQSFIEAKRDAEALKKQVTADTVDEQSIKDSTESQAAINATTNKLYRCFELLSGAPLNEQEIVSKNSQEFNSICPWAFTP
jgi:septal ring factor EnvC (AmiA/AmiB activator)